MTEPTPLLLMQRNELVDEVSRLRAERDAALAELREAREAIRFADASANARGFVLRLKDSRWDELPAVRAAVEGEEA